MRKAKDTRKKIKLASRKLLFSAISVFLILCLVSVGLIGRILFLQKTKGAAYERKVLSQQSYSTKELASRRGDIVDRNGNKIAISKKVFDLVLDPMLISSKEEYFSATAKALDKVFGISESKLRKILKGKTEKRYLVLKEYKNLSRGKVTKFKEKEEKDSNIKGVSFDERYVRKYPYNTVASKVIGFCTSDNQGIWGIESQYNSKLTGKSGRQYGYFDSDLNLVKTVKEPTNGNEVVSTIDINVQGILEKRMKEFQKNIGSKNMGVIIMNPQNGEIYAMSSYPEYDLNKPRDLSVAYDEAEIDKMTDKEKSEALNKLWRNYCISDAYEPGSTFKPMTIAACLDEGVTNGKKTYYCDGYQVVSGQKIKCVAYSRGGHGAQNVCQALMNSCNDVLMQVSADLGKDKFLKYNSDFGFGKKTGIDLPGEATGGVFTNETMHSVELATSSFGQGQTVTMIQLASAFSATINGGNYYEPHVVKEVKSDSGATVYSNNNPLVRKVITEGTSKKIRQYLKKTVEEGTANPAAVAGYSFGGKTGTAEKHPTGKGNYLVSFAGFTPTDNPEVMVYVVIDEPNVKDQAHSTYATEFSSKIMKEVLPLLGVYQSSGVDKKDKTKASKIKMPSNTQE